MESTSRLVRALSVSDLTWLYLVAVVNLNMVPVVAAEGFRSLWLWAFAVIFFFVPQGIAVVELAERMPGEGGLYLWTKETFGDFHGFLCGWCYWVTNMFFVPTLLFYLTSLSVYMGGPQAAALGGNRAFFLLITLSLLWLTVVANVRGLTVGKWINNIGAYGAIAIVVAMCAISAWLFFHGASLRWNELAIHDNETLPIGALGLVCFALVGLEIGSVMGDEIRNARYTVPRGVLFGGILCVVMYVGSTLSLLVTVPKSEMAVMQGMLQAAERMTTRMNLQWLLTPLAILMVLSIAGSVSAWVCGSARMLFVCGLDRYLPKLLGKVDSRHGSPYVALVFFGLLASCIILMSFVGASVKDAYLTLLDLGVALQMLAYAYLFSSLLRRAFSSAPISRQFPRIVLRVSSVAGLITVICGFFLAFVPTRQIESIWWYEMKMISTLLVFLGLAAGLFFYYSRQKTHLNVEALVQ